MIGAVWKRMDATIAAELPLFCHRVLASTLAEGKCIPLFLLTWHWIRFLALENSVQIDLVMESAGCLIAYFDLLGLTVCFAEDYRCPAKCDPE